MRKKILFALKRGLKLKLKLELSMQNFMRRLVAVVAICVHGPLFAADIDLFMGPTPSATDIPNVLIIMDNTANWNTAFTNEKAALASVFNGLPAGKFNVGIMMFTETGGGNAGNDGGYVRAAVRLMNSANQTKYAAMINSFDVVSDKSNSGKAGKIMQEAYLYFKGSTPYAGNGKNKTDYANNTSGTTQSAAVYALAGNALPSKTAMTYTSPIVPGCAKNYIIYISNGAASDSNADTTQAKAALLAAGGDTAMIALNPSGSQDNISDEWARFIKTSSVGATTYTVDINKVTTGQGPGWTALLKSMASQSSGKYFDVQSSGNQIADALNNIFTEIQPVSSVFSSVSLPLSVNTQGTLLNQVFIGMFRPDADAYPRWFGNLKQFKIGKVGTGVELQDANGVNAVNSQTGFLTECARSFWTPTTLDTEFSKFPSGDCLTVANSKTSNYPDGSVVEKGGQAYKLRATTTRTVKTCSPIMSSCQGPSGLLDFNNTNVTATMLGTVTTALQDTLIGWSKGLDTLDEDIDANTTETRHSVHGDVVHSRPAAINFGTEAAPNVVVFYGGNDGMLRAVNGNQTTAIGSYAAGSELWSFMPPEFYPQIKRLYDNSVPIAFAGSTGTTQPKPYGIDGSIASFKGKIGGSDKTFIYAGMRRGGRAMYAFDVTNTLTAPNSPTLKWKIGCPNVANDSDCRDGIGGTTGMDGIGQTWSTPRTMLASGYGSGTSPLLIMGGGYDDCEDKDALVSGGANHNCTSTSKGNKVYVIDADTGAVVKTFNTDRGVIAQQIVVSDTAGLAKYAYTADLGGNVYRITFGSGAVSSWTITKIASLGCNTTAACAANRKFMFVPSVVANGDEYTVMLGSGDREKPITYYTASGAVTNYFFSLIDKPLVASSTWPGAADCGTAILCKDSLLAITPGVTPTASALAAKKGWYLGLTATEQVVTSALTAFDTVAFSTHQPSVPVAGSCSANLGTARVYNVAFTNAASTNGTSSPSIILPPTIGLAPDPTGGTVKVDGVPLTICFSCGAPGGPLSPKIFESASSSAAKGRLYWYLQK